MGLLWRLGLPVATALVLIPLVRVLFLGFLDELRGTWSAGVEAVVLRGALVVIGWLSLDVYAALIRSPDRTVLSLLPVDTAAVVRAELLSVVAGRWWLVVGGAIVLAPIAWEGAALLWGLAVIVLLGAFAVGLTGSAMVHLLAVAIAEDPRWSGLLDFARGSNPRAQAAFIYAPGVVLIGSGLLAQRAAHGVGAAAAGDPLGGIELVLPFVVAGLCTLPLPRLARSQWFQGSAVVADIDARYAALEDPEEANRAYLDWVVRYLPAPVACHALNDLRHGWRMRRTLITGAWLAGTLAFAAGWTEAEAGPVRVAVLVVLATFAVAANGVLLARDEPPFLRMWLPPPGVPGALARAVVLALWGAPIGLCGALSVWIRRGSAEALWVLAIWALALIGAVVTSVGCGRLADRGLLVYGPLATVLAVALAAAVGSG